MYITNQWYLVALEDELLKQNPLGKKILGQEVVIFKTESGKIQVIENRCCHRNVALSMGYVKNEAIKCAYHGWEFDGTGKCVNIPSLHDKSQIPASACVKKYEVKIYNHMIWAFFGEASKAHEVALPPMPEIGQYPYVFNYHVVKADLKLVAESLIDPYHIDHVHRNSIKTFMGNLNRASVEFNIEMEGTAMTGSYMRENTGNFFEKFYFGFAPEIKTNFAFYFPHTSKLHIAFKEKNMFIYEHFYPIEDDKIMMLQITCWQGIFRRFPMWFAKKMMLDKSNKIVEEDIDFLECNKRYHDTQKLHDLLIKADKVSIEFAKLWRTNVEKMKLKAEATADSV